MIFSNQLFIAMEALKESMNKAHAYQTALVGKIAELTREDPKSPKLDDLHRINDLANRVLTLIHDETIDLNTRIDMCMEMMMPFTK